MKTAAIYFFVLILIAGGVNHLVNPKFYNRFIPDLFPKKAVNYIFGIIEIALGIGLVFEASFYWSAACNFLLMLGFLPLHTIDLFRDKPAIGSKTIAAIRLALQFVLIWAAWWLFN